MSLLLLETGRPIGLEAGGGDIALEADTAPEFWYMGDLLPELSVEVDVTTNPRSSSRVWTDITPYVRHVEYTRSGRNDEMQRTATGTMTVLCGDQGGAVSGLGITKRQWIRLRARWDMVVYPLWQGVFETVPRRWASYGSDPTVELQAADVFKILRVTPLDGKDSTTDPTIFGAVRNDQRVAGIVGLAMLDTGTISSDTDAADAVSDPIAVGVDALSTCIDIEASENGLLVAEPDGTVSFQGRHYRIVNSATSLATFGESAGEIPYQDDVEYDDTDVYVANPVTVTIPDGTSVTVSDDDYLDKNWGNPLQRNILSSNLLLAADCAHYLLNRYKDPAPRIPQISVQLQAVARHAAAEMPTLLGAGNSDRFTWTRDADTPISTDVFLEQIGGTIDREGTWDLSLQLSPASDDPAWALGQAGASELGQTTYLIY